MDIPFYTYTDNDFEIPISLQYASNGYMPNTPANYVGLGWILNAGGCISREVRGIRDNGLIEGTLPIYGYYRYYQYCNTSGHLNEKNKNPLVKEGSSTNCPFYTYIIDRGSEINIHTETESDIYTFNFLGHSGKFVISQDGPVVFDSNHPSGEYKINLDNFNKPIYQSQIQITTGDGYVYTFGINLGNDTDSYSTLYKRYGTNETMSYEIWGDEWHLTKITAPNGRIVTFDYIVNSSTVSESCRPTGQQVAYSQELIDGNIYGHFTNGANYDASYILSIKRYAALLQHISIDNIVSLFFQYTNRDNEKWKRETFSPDTLSTTDKLSKIIVRDSINGINLKECSIGYKYTSSTGNPVLLMDNLNISGVGTYHMTYYNETAALPYQGSTAIDHWGYYNNNNSPYIASIIPVVHIDANYRETIPTVCTRSPDGTKSIYGMLKEITYPTGGRTVFEYEPHTYGHRMFRDYTTLNKPQLLLCTGTLIAGGQRIKSRTDYSSVTKLSKRRYLYELSGISTGNMLDFPRYSIIVKAISGTPDNYFTNHGSSATNMPGYMMDRTFIEYSDVIEKYDDGSYMQYHFSNYSDTPDDFIHTDAMHLDYVLFTYEYPLYSGNFFRDPQSLFTQRGRLLFQKIYDNTYSLKEKREFVYQRPNPLPKIESARLTAADSVYIYQTYIDNYSLTSSITSYYHSNGTIEKRINYEYNNRKQISKTTSINQSGNGIIQRVYYVSDLTNRTPAEDSLLSRNILSEPLWTLTLEKRGASEYLTSAKHHIYNLFTGGNQGRILAKPSKVLSARIPIPINYTGITVLSTPIYDTLATFGIYNRYGRPCSITDANGINTIYLWGYGSLYPVMRLVNVTASQVNTLAHGDVVRSIFGWSGIGDTHNTLFRTIKDAAITTWYYTPFVGISKIIDTGGRSTSYEYDNSCRLYRIRDTNGNLLQQYLYSPDFKL